MLAIKKPFLAVSIFLQLSLACSALAEPLAPGTAEVAGSASVPSELFWWGPPSGLQHKLQQLQSHQLPPMAADANGMAPMIGAYFPDMMDRPALFSWTNPATGIGASQAEMYARPDPSTGEPPRLLMLRPKSSARAMTVQTRLPTIMDASEVHTQNIGAAANADLIFHQNYDASGSLLIQEWIIRNPNAIESYTADPEALRPYLERELNRISDPSFQYSASELHSRELRINSGWGKERIRTFFQGVLSSTQGSSYNPCVGEIEKRIKRFSDNDDSWTR